MIGPANHLRESSAAEPVKRPTVASASSALAAALLVMPISTNAQRAQPNTKSLTAAYVHQEWTVPWIVRGDVHGPVVDEQGRVWFTEELGGYVAYFDRQTEEFRRFPIDSNSKLTDLIAARGNIWITSSTGSRLIKFNPITELSTSYRIPDSIPRNPSAVVFDSRADIVWFTAWDAETVGRLDPSTGGFMWWELVRNSRPLGITLDSQGRPWFCESGTNKIGMIDPVTRESKQLFLPAADARPQRLTVTSDDFIWYSDSGRNRLGRLDPRNGAVEEFLMSGRDEGRLGAVTIDDRDVLWVIDLHEPSSALTAFDTKRRTWLPSFDIPASPGRTVYGMKSSNAPRSIVFDRSSRRLWFITQDGILAEIEVPK